MRVIVHLFGALDPGGAEIRTLEELRRRDLAEERHVFVTLSGREGALAGDFRALGCEVVPAALGARFPLTLVRLLRQVHATHVHSHVHLASGYLLLLARAARTPVRIAHLRSVGDGRRPTVGRYVYRTVARALLLSCATDVVAVSEAVRDGVLGNGRVARRCRIVYDRIDGSRFPVATTRDDGVLRLVMVGRLDREKNPLRAVEIVASLAGRSCHRPVRLQLVGRATDGSQVDAIDRLARELSVSGSVEVVGQRDDVPALLAASDVLVATTTREGLPGAIIEASAAGIPAVVSAIPPNEEAGRWLPGVVTMPLEADDAAWCDAIEGATAARATTFAPHRLRTAFERSPFSLSDGPSELDRLWA